MLLQELNTGLVSQEILVFTLDHPGVTRGPEVEYKGVEDEVIIGTNELLQNCFILFL